MQSATEAVMARRGDVRIVVLVALALGCSEPAADTARNESTAGEQTPSEPEPEAEPESEATQPEARAAAPEPHEVAGPPSTEGWAAILEAYVTDDGGFRYEALRSNSEHVAALDAYVAAIAAANPEPWSMDARLAFYINAYNALTIHSVLELWPVTSVMQEDGFFEEREHEVAGETLTLNGLENEVIREGFSEPRIHFAVNCASKGCPPLHGEPFTAENLESNLETLTTEFVRSTTRIRGRRVQVSQLFEWFEGDFEEAGGVRAFLARYLEGEAKAAVENERTRITHFEYDWDLNGRD